MPTPIRRHHVLISLPRTSTTRNLPLLLGAITRLRGTVRATHPVDIYAVFVLLDHMPPCGPAHRTTPTSPATGARSKKPAPNSDPPQAGTIRQLRSGEQTIRANHDNIDFNTIKHGHALSQLPPRRHRRPPPPDWTSRKNHGVDECNVIYATSMPPVPVSSQPHLPCIDRYLPALYRSDHIIPPLSCTDLLFLTLHPHAKLSTPCRRYASVRCI